MPETLNRVHAKLRLRQELTGLNVAVQQHLTCPYQAGGAMLNLVDQYTDAVTEEYRTEIKRLRLDNVQLQQAAAVLGREVARLNADRPSFLQQLFHPTGGDTVRFGG